VKLSERCSAWRKRDILRCAEEIGMIPTNPPGKEAA
jgi:hypothetical protein